ncbi:MAG: hypothetical protein WC595_00625 [Candidatus Nanoarchaeia archaeon]
MVAEERLELGTLVLMRLDEVDLEDDSNREIILAGQIVKRGRATALRINRSKGTSKRVEDVVYVVQLADGECKPAGKDDLIPYGVYPARVYGKRNSYNIFI